MRVGILSFRPLDKPISYEEGRLRTAARELGYKSKVLRAANCELYFDKAGLTLYYSGEKFPHLDVIIPRVSILNNVDLQSSVVRQLELVGMPVLNKYDAIVRAKNKLKTLQILSHYGIPIPKTVVIGSCDDLKSAIDRVGGAPVILKYPFGSLGSGVVIAESYRAALSTLDLLWSSAVTQIMLVQEYVKESKGKDTRIFVVGGKVVTSIQRSAKKGEFRSNVALGGSGKRIEISDEYKDIAIKSAELLGLEMAGVDIITTNNGPAVLEVNCNPGFEELEEATGVDVAKVIVERAVELPVA